MVPESVRMGDATRTREPAAQKLQSFLWFSALQLFWFVLFAMASEWSGDMVQSRERQMYFQPACSDDRIVKTHLPSERGAKMDSQSIVL